MPVVTEASAKEEIEAGSPDDNIPKTAHLVQRTMLYNGRQRCTNEPASSHIVHQMASLPYRHY